MKLFFCICICFCNVGLNMVLNVFTVIFALVFKSFSFKTIWKEKMIRRGRWLYLILTCSSSNYCFVMPSAGLWDIFKQIHFLEPYYSRDVLRLCSFIGDQTSPKQLFRSKHTVLLLDVSLEACFGPVHLLQAIMD